MCQMCVDVSHVLKGQQFMTFGVYFLMIVIATVLCIPSTPCILIMGLYSVLFITAAVFIYGSIWLAKINLKKNGNVFLYLN